MDKINFNRKKGWIILLFISCICYSNTYGYEEVRPINGFESVNFNISGVLYLEQGDSFLVKIVGEQKEVENITTEIRNKTLVIKTKKGLKSMKNIKMYVTMPVVKNINISGSGDIIADRIVSSEDIKLNISGSGSISFNDLTTENINLLISGSGSITIKGETKDFLKLSITGSGSVSAEEFLAKSVNVNITGSGNAKVNAQDNLTTNIVGSGDVYYVGNPIVNAKSTGSGSTKQLN